MYRRACCNILVFIFTFYRKSVKIRSIQNLRTSYFTRGRIWMRGNLCPISEEKNPTQQILMMNVIQKSRRCVLYSKPFCILRINTDSLCQIEERTPKQSWQVRECLYKTLWIYTVNSHYLLSIKCWYKWTQLWGPNISNSVITSRSYP